MTENMKQLTKEDFNYKLPDNLVAHYPLENRSLSKLLVYKDGADIKNSQVKDLAQE